MRPTVGNTAKYDRGRSFGRFLLHFYNILRNYNMLNVETPMFFTSKKLSIKIFGILLSKCYNFVIIKNIDEMVVLK